MEFANGGCPVAANGAVGIDTLSVFRQQATQRLISDPGNTAATLSVAEGSIRDYYAKVTEANPLLGAYKVTRAMRSITLSAAYFNGATFYMNELAPKLESYNARTDNSEPFVLSEYIKPLPSLEVFTTIQTEQSRRFMQELNGVIYDWAEIGFLDPDPEYYELAAASYHWHERYEEAALEADKISSVLKTEDPQSLALKTAEDNAHAIMHTLISLASLSSFQAGSRLTPEYLACDAVLELDALSGLASISRQFANAKIRPMQRPDWRAPVVKDYEAAVLSGLPMARESSALYFIAPDGVVRSPHPSLAAGAWREPGMCAGFPRFSARTIDETRGNQAFISGVATLVANLIDADDESELRWFGSERQAFSSTEAGFSLGILAALNTIYPDFPAVI